MSTTGPVIVVTGASSGIGAAAAVELARRGARVIPVGRDERRLGAVAERIAAEDDGAAAEPLRADFASLADVRRLAAEIRARHERIDVLVNNAGILSGRRELTEDGHERTFAVNHLAPFLLTNMLLDRLRAAGAARIVTTSSDAHHSGRIEFDDLTATRSWSTWSSYATSKLANVLFTHALARRLHGTGATANCFHPGVIRTRLGRGGRPIALGWKLVKPFFRSPERGAATMVYLATNPEAGRAIGLLLRRLPGEDAEARRGRRRAGRAAVADERGARRAQLAWASSSERSRKVASMPTARSAASPR